MKLNRIVLFFLLSLRLCAIPLVVVVIIQSCSSVNNKDKTKVNSNETSTTNNEIFKTGEIIDNVICKNDASQSYSLYLPSTYSSEKMYPVIYAFDPHGVGKYPISLYKNLAEKYNYIVVGSNNSKNGTTWDESQAIANRLFEDAPARLSIDSKRIYVLGFSGGARVANGLAITNGSISGVVCCGAAAPAANSPAPRNDYTFLGIVGNEDFNYVEMKKYDKVDLAGHNIKHVLLTFNGKHEWPAESIMDEAFWWLELNNMRKNPSAKNDTLLSKKMEPLQKQLKIAVDKGEQAEAFDLCKKTICFYDQLVDLTSFYDAYKVLQKSPEIDRLLKLEEHDWTEEEALKQYYLKAFQTQNFAWWTNDIKALNKKIATDKNKNKVLIYKRTLSFLSLASFMQTNGALKQNALPAADFFCKIYLLVDPENKDAHYLAASIYNKQGNTKLAIASLENAVKYGYTDSEQLKTDASFESIRNTNEFQNVVKSIKVAP